MSNTGLVFEFDVFLSYANEDVQRARRFVDLFQRQGWKVFWDRESIPPGVPFRDFIRTSLGRSRCIVVLWSRSSINSDWVIDEATAGRKPERLVPVMLDPLGTDDLPMGLQSIHAARLEDWDGVSGDEPRVSTLLRQLALRIGADERKSAALRLNSGEARQSTSRAPRAKAWAWSSRGRSADEGVISVLGIVETILAMSIYLLIARELGTLHLTIASILAPLLLLRTERSVALGAEMVNRLTGRLGLVERIMSAAAWPLFRDALTWVASRRIFRPVVFRWTEPVVTLGLFLVLGPLSVLWFAFRVIFILFVVMAVAIAAPVIRFIATAVPAVASPLVAIRAIPKNWFRNVACVDFLQAPESVPGVAARPEDDLILHLFSHPTLRGEGPMRIASWPLLMPVLIPAVLYRWSLKGTAIVWSPLMWIVRGAFRSGLTDRLRDIKELAVFRVARTWSLVTAAALSAKLIAYNAHAVNVPCTALVSIDTCREVVVPDGLPWWQVAALVNCVLTWVMYLVADWALHRMKAGRLPGQLSLKKVFETAWLVRGVLSLYTIFCSVYLAALLSRKWDLQPLGTNLLP
jgi:hypothetical protein